MTRSFQFCKLGVSNGHALRTDSRSDICRRRQVSHLHRQNAHRAYGVQYLHRYRKAFRHVSSRCKSRHPLHRETCALWLVGLNDSHLGISQAFHILALLAPSPIETYIWPRLPVVCRRSVSPLHMLVVHHQLCMPCSRTNRSSTFSNPLGNYKYCFDISKSYVAQWNARHLFCLPAAGYESSIQLAHLHAGA